MVVLFSKDPFMDFNKEKVVLKPRTSFQPILPAYTVVWAVKICAFHSLTHSLYHFESSHKGGPASCLPFLSSSNGALFKFGHMDRVAPFLVCGHYRSASWALQH